MHVEVAYTTKKSTVLSTTEDILVEAYVDCRNICTQVSVWSFLFVEWLEYFNRFRCNAS